MLVLVVRFDARLFPVCFENRDKGQKQNELRRGLYSQLERVFPQLGSVL